MEHCRECDRLWRCYKYGLTLRYRLDRKLAEAAAALNLARFNELSSELTQTEIALAFLRPRIEQHERTTVH